MGLRVVNLPETARLLPDGGVDVHGAPARGIAMHSNGNLGADLLYVAAGDAFPVHTHPGDHLLYCVSGVGTISIDGETFKVHQGDLYFVEGLVPHAVGAITDHVLMAVGSPHKAIDSPERMTWCDWQGRRVSVPLPADRYQRLEPDISDT